MHACVWPGCSKVVDPGIILCGSHWNSTPFELKRGMRGSWDSGREFEEQSLAFKRAYQEFEQWIQATFAGEQERHDPGRWERLKQLVRDRDEARKARISAKENPDATET